MYKTWPGLASFGLAWPVKYNGLFVLSCAPGQYTTHILIKSVFKGEL